MEALEAQEDVEIIRGPKSLMKHALTQSGSRDVSAQLFTALCRALGIPARLVVSLQSVPWQSSVGKVKTTTPPSRKKGHAGTTNGTGKDPVVQPEDGEGEDESESAETSLPDVKGKGKAKETSVSRDDQFPDGRSAKRKAKAEPVIKLRKQKPKGQAASSSSSPRPRRQGTHFCPSHCKHA